MKRFTLLSTLVFVLDAAAFTFQEAQAIYKANFRESPPSIQESGDYVFVIQEGVIDPLTTGNGINRITIRGQLDALNKYIGQPTGKVVSPFTSSVTAKLLTLVNFRIPECASCKIEESRVAGKFRHVSAFDAMPLRKAREDAQSGRPVSYTTSEWRELIDLKLTALGLEREKEKFWAELGAVTPLMAKIGGVQWMIEHGDGVVIEQTQLKWRGDESAKECYAALQVNPVFSPALLRLAELKEKDGIWVPVISRRLKAAIGKPDVEGLLRVSEMATKKYGSAAWREYAGLYAKVVNGAENMKVASTPLWRYALNSFGRLEFPPATKENQQKAAALFNEGKNLFAQGRELDRILKLFQQSIELDARSPEKWRYYGAALRTANKNLDAVVAYHQALTLNNKDNLALTDVCLLYEKLGYHELAVGTAWYILVNSSDNSLRDKVNRIVPR